MKTHWEIVQDEERRAIRAARWLLRGKGPHPLRELQAMAKMLTVEQIEKALLEKAADEEARHRAAVNKV